MFNDMYSAGSQIGRMAALLEVLLKASKGKAALQSPDARDAVDAFEEMQTAIQKAKAERAPERAFVKQLTRCKHAIPRDTNGPLRRYALACEVSPYGGPDG